MEVDGEWTIGMPPPENVSVTLTSEPMSLTRNVFRMRHTHRRFAVDL